MPPFTIAVVLVKPRFPENIGMAARACANFGCRDLRLVAPERWDYLKAEPLATAQGTPILQNLRILPDLASAINDQEFAIGTSARLGTRRGNAITPETIARKIGAWGLQKVALVFGPEDRGLTNDELQLCQGLIHIPTASTAGSLNLAQAVLLVLHEFQKTPRAVDLPAHGAKFITTGEWHLLATSFKQVLAALNWPAANNPDYFFRQWTGIFRNGRLTRQEFDTLMGFARQILNRLDKHRD